MRITELYIRGFGKFSGQRFFLEDGVQVIEGENEFGKSTLHAFIRAMLFGMERGRGRAAARDDFTRYEPWDEPGRYGGMMRFVCGDSTSAWNGISPGSQSARIWCARMTGRSSRSQTGTWRCSLAECAPLFLTEQSLWDS